MKHANHISHWADSNTGKQPFYLAVIDPHARLSFVNAAFYKTFHGSQNDLKNRSLLEMIHPQDRDRASRLISQCRTEGRSVKLDIRLKTGSYKWIKWEFSPLQGSELHEGKLLCLGHDRTEKDEPSDDSGNMPEDIFKIGDLKSGLVKRAQEEERARLAKELHDNVNQMLASAQLFLEQLNPGNSDFAFIKNKTYDILTMAIEELRNLSRNMVMPGFLASGLIASIRKLVEELNYCKAFNTQFHCQDNKAVELLDQPLKTTLFRIVQEQVKNIIKYSKAGSVRIDLHCDAGQVRLEITDDGQGFDPSTVRRGLGLSNIHDRANHYHGKMILDSSPGEGCRLIVNIPLSLAT